MKTLTVFKPIRLFWIGLILCFPLIGGCQKEEMDDDGKKTTVIPLSDIVDHPDYASLPLIGTKWKLIGFVNAKSGKVDLVKDFFDESFILVIKEDGSLIGNGGANVVSGSYAFDLSTKGITIIVPLGRSTMAGSTPDEDRYVETMSKVKNFSISSKGLSIYYDAGKYLLFGQAENCCSDRLNHWIDWASSDQDSY